jgi:hypothetical protein
MTFFFSFLLSKILLFVDSVILIVLIFDNFSTIYLLALDNFSRLFKRSSRLNSASIPLTIEAKLMVPHFLCL